MKILYIQQQKKDMEKWGLTTQWGRNLEDKWHGKAKTGPVLSISVMT